MYIYMLLAICALTSANVNNRLWGLLGNVINASHKYVPEDARLNITQLAIKYDHPIEEHKVTTADGYIINVHRMRVQRLIGKNSPIVFLMHGILESSDSWLLMGPGKGLAFILADSGFDVWMGNARGNKHALSHVVYTTSSPKFWDFTWEELGIYDLPAMIDYILKETGQESLYYVGHSQGTTIGYVLGSMKPEYNSKIRIMFSLAPEAWMGNIRSPMLKMFVPSQHAVEKIMHDLNAYSTSMGFLNKITTVVCNFLPGSCDNILHAFAGDKHKVNDKFLSVILGHWPTGASTRQFIHYGQLVESHRFCRFDYGPDWNKVIYGRKTPPDYDLSKLTAQVVIFYSSKDWLSDPQDVEKLIRNLPHVYDYIFLDDFTHIDYVYSAEAVGPIYNTIIGMIYKFEESHGSNHSSHTVSDDDHGWLKENPRADGNLKNESTVWC